MIFNNAIWIHDSVHSFDPECNTVVLGDGSSVTYDYLVVATGIQINWNQVPGMADADVKLASRAAIAAVGAKAHSSYVR